MRAIIATANDQTAAWLHGVLGSAGISVSILEEIVPDAPELLAGDLLIVDSESAAMLGSNGPRRRMLIVPRGRFIDVSEAIGAGFVDLLVVPSPEDEVLARVGRALNHVLKSVRAPETAKTQTAEFRSIADRVVEALARAAPETREEALNLAQGMLSVFVLLIDAHESTERGAPGHSKRTAALTGNLARELGVPEAAVEWLQLAARLQDIGMLPLRLPLNEAAPLSAELRRSLSAHPTLSADILAPLAAWGLPIDGIRWHHERIDGFGYPDRLRKDAVPLEAQILGAADCFEALTSARPWRPAEGAAEALEAMRTMRGFSDGVLDALETAVATRRAQPAPQHPRPPAPHPPDDKG